MPERKERVIQRRHWVHWFVTLAPNNEVSTTSAHYSMADSSHLASLDFTWAGSTILPYPGRRESSSLLFVISHTDFHSIPCSDNTAPNNWSPASPKISIPSTTTRQTRPLTMLWPWPCSALVFPSSAHGSHLMGHPSLSLILLTFQDSTNSWGFIHPQNWKLCTVCVCACMCVCFPGGNILDFQS